MCVQAEESRKHSEVIYSVTNILASDHQETNSVPEYITDITEGARRSKS